jgi:flagellar basal-body rod protein FlgG
MPKIAYTAASAMHVETQALDLAARNLAHLTTPGYRREVFLHQGFAQTLRDQGRTGDLKADGGHGQHTTGSWFDHRPGETITTDAPLDLALGDRGYFRVTGPDDRLLLTRAGHFQLDDQQRLVTPDGWPLHGQAGPITLPAGSERIIIDRTGRITALVRDGTALREAVVDQVRIADVADPRRLHAVNGQYFTADEAPADLAVPDVRQGVLERANVNPMQELAAMIAIQRRHDAAQKALHETTNLGGQVSDLLRGS